MNRILLCMLAILTMAACSKNEDIGQENNNESSKPAQITLDASSADFAAEGGSSTVSFTSSAKWTAELVNDRADSWCDIDPKSGPEGNAKITVTTKPNETPDNRSASILIKAGSTSKTIIVSQKQKDALTVTASKFEIGSEGGEITVKVKANIDFEYSIEESAKEWIEYTATRALETSSLVFYVKENNSPEKREAKIQIKSGDFNETVNIYQAGSTPSIILTQNEYTIPSAGETIAVEVKSNVDVQVEIPAGVEWITENRTRAFSTNTYYFTIAENETYDPRTAEISFTNTENGLCETIKVTQVQKDAIVLAASEYDFDVSGGELDFEIQTNVEISVSVSDGDHQWIQQITTRGLETKSLHFNISAHTAENDREGTITLSGGNAIQTIRIKQKGLGDYLEKQRAALIDLYNATGGDNWTDNTNWCSDKPVSEWYGIGTDEAGRVYFLALGNNNLTGILPESIGDLVGLTSLSADLNNLKGNIPESIGNLVNLEFLSLGMNKLSGKIPESIGNLTKLIYLIIDYNEISGSIPESIGNLRELTNIHLEENNLSGSIPESIGKLTKLGTLAFSGNKLTGELPNSIGNLTELKGLYLFNNDFKSSIPESIGKLTNLEELHLDFNKFYGKIPESIGNLTKLRNFAANNNSLTGSIPESIGNMESLEGLWLDSNSLTGEIPKSIGNLSNLKKIYLIDNGLSGSIPETVNNLANLEIFHIRDNYFTGTVPKRIMELETWPTWWHYVLSQRGDGFSSEGLIIPAPKFREDTIDGEIIDYSVYSENKYTVLYHYFDWCHHTYTFTPVLMELYQGYRNKGLEVISFSNEGTVASNREFANLFNTEWPYITLNNEKDIFNAFSWISPGVFVVDQDGYVIFNPVTEDHHNLAQFLLEKLGEPDPSYVPDAPKLYESTDYSKDGEVKQLQKATKGNGINIVLMGDAYTDRLITDGTYDKTMHTAMEMFFTEEPYKSFRDHFNVYSVTAVSKNEIYSTFSDTAFKAYFGLETTVGGDDPQVFSYALKAISEEDMDEAIIIVMMNTMIHAGTCYMYGGLNTGDWSNGVSISYFAGNIEKEPLKGLILHEAAGHGFAKLADEYAYADMGHIPNPEIEYYNYLSKYGWWKNVDFTNDPSEVKWNYFLSDERYANDGLGIYEGAVRYWTGAYRPTVDSIMRYNHGGFNAPSREAIYYRINKLSYGADWEYDYEEFVKWDERNRTGSASGTKVPYRMESIDDYVPTHSPVIIPHPWYEAK